MKIVLKQDAPIRENKKEKRTYYLFDEYEFILTEIQPGHKQPWHSHKSVKETTLTLKGAIQVFGKNKTPGKLNPGDLVIFDPGENHTIYNNTKSPALLVTLKNIPMGKNFRDIFKNDKKTI